MARGRSSRQRTAISAAERAAQWEVVVPMQYGWLHREVSAADDERPSEHELHTPQHEPHTPEHGHAPHTPQHGHVPHTPQHGHEPHTPHDFPPRERDGPRDGRPSLDMQLEMATDSERSPGRRSPVPTSPTSPTSNGGGRSLSTEKTRPARGRQDSFERLRRRARSLAQTTSRAAANAATAPASYLRRKSVHWTSGSLTPKARSAPANEDAILRARRLSV